MRTVEISIEFSVNQNNIRLASNTFSIQQTMFISHFLFCLLQTHLLSGEQVR